MIQLATLFDSKYLARGLALIASLQRHVPAWHLWVLALDSGVWSYFTRNSVPNVTAICFDEFATEQILGIQRERTHQEFCWTLESVFTDWAMRRYALESLAYMDADCWILSDLAPLYNEVGNSTVAIIPHRWTPKHAARLSVNGTYNVSWVYFSGERGRECLKVWRDQCLAWCFARNEGGKFADQGYLEDWPQKWGAHIVKHIGANVAPWGCDQYKYAVDDFDGKRLFVIEHNGESIKQIVPVLFYHVHDWRSEERRSGYTLPDDIIRHIYLPYEAEIRQIKNRLGQ